MDKVKARLIELVPEIRSPWHLVHRNNLRCTNCGEDTNKIFECSKGEERPITLADVLRAIDMPVKYYSGVKTPTIKIDVVRLLAIWNLAEHFDNQTPEVKAFIGKLIGVTE